MEMPSHLEEIPEEADCSFSQVQGRREGGDRGLNPEGKHLRSVLHPR